MKTIDDLGDLRARRVLVRADLNVPLAQAESGSVVAAITDDRRIRASLPTINDLRERRAKVIVCAHLGRPKGTVDPRFSLAPVAKRLGELLAAPVTASRDVVGPSAHEAVGRLQAGDVALLENLRFESGETSKNDGERAAFADKLAALAEAYVGDGFGAVHRKHASVYDVPQRLPHAAGWLVQEEVDVLRRLTESPERPYAVVLGGAKVSDKLGVIGSLLRSADRLLIGGAMAFTFLKAQGREVGTSRVEADQLDAVSAHMEEARRRGVEIVLPVDIVGAAELSADAPYAAHRVDEFPADRMGLDIGPESATLFAERLADAATAFWNGPMGVFEMTPYEDGTRAVATALTKVHGLTVVGGGDTAAAIRKLGFSDDAFGHISTGGGASLEYLEGRTLPGLAALEA